MTKEEALELALDFIIATNKSSGFWLVPASNLNKVVTAIKEALAPTSTPCEVQPEQEPVLQNIEQYRLQMAGISTAALGYWKEGDGIHPDYNTVALRDVAKLYAKYDALYKAQPEQEPVAYIRKDQLQKAAQSAMLCEVTPEPRKDRIRIYTTPPKRPWVGLTDEQRNYCVETPFVSQQWANIEDKLRELNT